MEKYYKQLIAVLCSVCMIFSMFSIVLADAPIEEKGAFVVIGDSIAFGAMLEDTKDSYASIMAEKLGLDEVNISVNGYDSEDVLKQLETDEAVEAIKSASVISLSVGGNNILKTIIQNAEDITDLSGLLKMISPDLIAQLTEGIAVFENDFPVIIETIKEINPDAQIIVQTVYNPYKFVNTGSLIDFASISDSIIVKLNNVIISYFNENPDAFILSDVYTAFEEKAEATFINADFDTMNVDPHPSKEGHALIAETNLAALEAPVSEAAELLEEDDTTLETAAEVITDALENVEELIAQLKDMVSIEDMTAMLTDKAAEKFKEIVKVDYDAKIRLEDAEKISEQFSKIFEMLYPAP